MAFNFDKYNPKKKPPLHNWKESDSVILLSEYLRINKNQGISICQSAFDGEPCLHFNPGLQPKKNNPGRWEVAENAWNLLLEAADDLKELVSNGLIKLPVSYHVKQRVLPKP